MAYATTPQSIKTATLHVSDDLPATEDQAGYEDVAVVYTAVGEVIDLGSLSDETSLITYTPVETGVVRKLKGSRNYGSQTIQYARVFGDAGQVILLYRWLKRDVRSQLSIQIQI